MFYRLEFSSVSSISSSTCETDVEFRSLHREKGRRERKWWQRVQCLVGPSPMLPLISTRIFQSVDEATVTWVVIPVGVPWSRLSRRVIDWPTLEATELGARIAPNRSSVPWKQENISSFHRDKDFIYHLRYVKWSSQRFVLVKKYKIIRYFLICSIVEQWVFLKTGKGP